MRCITGRAAECMLFNSYAFILAFLPAVFAGYFLIGRYAGFAAAQIFLCAASVFFYGYWNPWHVPLLAASVLFNFTISRAILRGLASPSGARIALAAGIVGDLALLGWYKYSGFASESVSQALGLGLAPLHTVLPLGISFFTFTQIAFLVDTYRGLASRPGIVNYALFVTYFPHLLAGPILHHREMMPQFDDPANRILAERNLAAGLALFAIGLFKKTVLADGFAVWADDGYSRAPALASADAWVAVFAYALQLYFDFSGYTDMALGMSRLFNIRLPINFDAPYRACSIREFWLRWHMTLSRFLRDYLYIPLGGNRGPLEATLRNLMLTFVLGGLWHGAGWNFVVWGALHGAAMAVQRVWTRFGVRLPPALGWLLTFLFVQLAWVFFRAPSLADALDFLRCLAGSADTVTAQHGWNQALLLAAGLAVATLAPTSNAWVESLRPSVRSAAVAAVLLAGGFIHLSRTGAFLYFNF